VTQAAGSREVDEHGSIIDHERADLGRVPSLQGEFFASLVAAWTTETPGPIRNAMAVRIVMASVATVTRVRPTRVSDHTTMLNPTSMANAQQFDVLGRRVDLYLAK
jgi:hypothetical protein